MTTDVLPKKKMNTSQKIHVFFYILFLSFLALHVITGWRGQIPAETDLNYTEGYVGIDNSGDGGYIVALRPLNGKGELTYFSCSYPTLFTMETKSCGDLSYLKRYENKYAKIGWYQPNIKFALQSHGHQMVTMTSEGDYYKNYAGIKSGNKTQNILLVLLMVIFGGISYPIFRTLIYPKS